jgi:hypothetical protein
MKGVLGPLLGSNTNWKHVGENWRICGGDLIGNGKNLHETIWGLQWNADEFLENSGYLHEYLDICCRL